MNIGLVPRRDRHRQAVPFQKSLIDSIHLLDKGELEMQPGLCNRIAHRLAELGNNDLFNLVDRVEAAKQPTEQQQRSRDYNHPKASLLVHLASSGLIDSGRIGSSCFMESSII